MQTTELRKQSQSEHVVQLEHTRWGCLVAHRSSHMMPNGQGQD